MSQGVLNQSTADDGRRFDARGVPHCADCKCQIVHHYKCAACGRDVGWCLGAHDDHPADCDDCWYAKTLAEETKAAIRQAARDAEVRSWEQ